MRMSCSSNAIPSSCIPVEKDGVPFLTWKSPRLAVKEVGSGPRPATDWLVTLDVYLSFFGLLEKRRWKVS